MNRRSGRLGSRPAKRGRMASAPAPLPARPSSPIPGRGRGFHRSGGQSLPGVNSGNEVFLRNYVLETMRRSGRRPQGSSKPRSLGSLMNIVEEMSGWEAMAMAIQPN